MKLTLSWRIALAIITSLTVLVLAPFIGILFISPGDLVVSGLQHEIFFMLRLPRVLTAFAAGAGLSLCGLVFQALFRNPLADPFTLGIASGASCGAALTITAGLTGSLWGVSFIAIGAFSGSVLAILMVIGFASLRRSTSKLTILLSGVAISYLFSSLLMFFQYIGSPHDSFYIIRWLLGGIEVIGYQPVLSIVPFEVVAFLIIALHFPQLDLLLTGDDIARSRGVAIVRSRTLLLIAATLLVGSIVAVCGPIAFVGLIVPHLCRTLFSWKHAISGPLTLLCGGTFLVVGDTIARTIIAPTEIPVGIITALLGSPFFLWILFRKKSGSIIDGL